VVSVYVHVPFCARRCGYCDFNTYTQQRVGLTANQWLTGVRAEVELAASQRPGPVQTVFFGGGTPTLLGAQILSDALNAVRETFGLVDGAEVTVEANPETVTPQLLDDLLTGGFTRLSLGMQSSDPNVLAVLDRAHQPGQALRCVQQAKQAGFGDVSLDLIYGTPGESLTSWQASLQAALSVEPQHISCYALIVEPGTPLARRIANGELPAPDDDLMADEYVLADQLLANTGLAWYELSNWAMPGHECRHNLAYWRSDDWWGVGPGAHSHLARRRWWNHKHPRTWASALARGDSPQAGFELVDDTMAHEERLLLELRLATGLPVTALTPTETARLPSLIEDNLIEVVTRQNTAQCATGEAVSPHVILTLQGRLLADQVTRDLLD